MEIKQSTSFPVAVLLIDNINGNRMTGVAAGSVTCWLLKGGSAVSKNVSGAWTEVSSANMPGWYVLTLSTTDTNTLGFLGVDIAVANAEKYADRFKIVANEEKDTFDRIGDTLGFANIVEILDLLLTTMTDGFDAVDSDMITVQGDLTTIKSSTQEIEGLVHKNAVIDQQVYNVDGHLTSARLRTYDTSANATSAGGTGLRKTYQITATWSGDELTSYKMVTVP